jgi:predicted phage-related endonuclease
MPIERVNLTSDREKWLRERMSFVSASDIGVVCGEAGYGSLAELFAEMKGLRPPRQDNDAMKRGRWGEASVFEALLDQYPEWRAVRAKVHVRDTERRIACTPDGFAEAPDRDGKGVVQAKVVSRSVFRDHWLDDPEDSIRYGAATPPASFVLQTLTEEMLNQTSWGVLAVLINGEYTWDFRLFDVERDPVKEDRILYRSDWFLRTYLDQNIMPPYEPLRDAELVKLLHPRDDGTEIDLTGDNRVLAAVDELIETQAACKRMQGVEKGLKTELQGKLGDHTYGRLGDGRWLSWKHQHRKAYAVEATDFRAFKIINRKPEATR